MAEIEQRKPNLEGIKPNDHAPTPGWKQVLTERERERERERVKTKNKKEEKKKREREREREIKKALHVLLLPY